MTPHHCWKRTRGLPACGDSFPRALALKLADRIATCSEILGRIAEGGSDVKLSIPDVRQAAGHTCGGAALEAYFRFYGLPAADWIAHLPNPVQGIAPDTIEAVLWSVFGRCCRGSMDTDSLRYHTRRGHPVLCPISDPVLGGHWVVVSSVVRGKVGFHCPVKGPCELPAADWEEGWRDAAGGRSYERFGLVGWPT